MNFDIKGVHVEITDEIRDFVEKKTQRLDFASDHIVDLIFTISQEKRQFSIDANVHFRWGTSKHLSASSFDIFEGIDQLVDKMERMINKEKEKIQEHKGQDSVRSDEAVLEES